MTFSQGVKTRHARPERERERERERGSGRVGSSHLNPQKKLSHKKMTSSQGVKTRHARRERERERERGGVGSGRVLKP